MLPNISTFSRHSNVLVSCHDAQLQHKRGHVLPELPVCSKVGYRNHVTNKFDVGIISARDARSITIHTENGVYVSQNHTDLKRADTPFEPKTQPFMSSNAKSEHAPPTTPVPSSTNIKCTGKVKLTEKRVEVRKSNLTNSMYTTRSGHISKPATRLITHM